MDPLHFGDSRLRLGGDVEGIAVSPNGRVLALGSGHGDETSLWTLPNGELVARCSEPSRSLAFSADGTTLWLAHAAVLRWRLGEPGPTAFRSAGEIGAPIALSPDGKVLAAGRRPLERREIVLVDTSDGRELGTAAHDLEYLAELSFSHDGRRLAFGGTQQAVVVDVATGRVLRTHAPPTGGRGVLAVFCPTRDVLAVAAVASTRIGIFVRDEPARVLELSFELESFGFASDGAELWVRRRWSGSVALLDVGQSTQRTAEVAPGGVSCVVAAVPGGGLVATTLHQARVVERDALGPLPIPPGHASGVSAVAVSPDGMRLATAGGHDRTVNVWSTRSATHERTLRDHDNYVASVSFSGDGALLATVGADGTLRIYDVAPGTLRAEVVRAHGGADLSAVRYDPTGTWLATLCEQGAVVLRDPRTGAAKREITRALPSPSSLAQGTLAWSSDGTLLASIGAGDDLEVHDVTTGARVFAARATACGALAFAQHARWLAYRDGQKVVVQDLAANVRLREHAVSFVTSLAFDAGGRLALAPFHEPVCIVDPRDHALPVSLGADDVATVVAFASDGKLVLGRSNGVTTLRDAPDAPLTVAEQHDADLRARRARARDVLARLAHEARPQGYRDSQVPRTDDDATAVTLELPPSVASVTLGVRASGRVMLSIAVHPEGGSAPAPAPTPTPVHGANLPAEPSTFARLALWVRARLRRQSAPPSVRDGWVAAALGDERAVVARQRERERSLELDVELHDTPTHEALAALVRACVARANVR